MPGVIFSMVAFSAIALAPKPPEQPSEPEWVGWGEDVEDKAILEEENEDIDEPELTWAEAHCAPKHYHPPDHLVPDRWHPANVLTGAKP